MRSLHQTNHVPCNLPHSGRVSIPSFPTTFPRSHSLPSPFLFHFTSSSLLSPPFSHFPTSSSVNPADRSRSAPCCFQRCRSRSASRAWSQSFSESKLGHMSWDGSYLDEKCESIAEEEANFPRPRAWTLGGGGGGSGPTMDSKGSESDGSDCCVLFRPSLMSFRRVDRLSSLVPLSPDCWKALASNVEDDVELSRRRLRLWLGSLSSLDALILLSRFEPLPRWSGKSPSCDLLRLRERCL